MSLDSMLINLQIGVKHLFLPMSLTARDVLEHKLSGFRNPGLVREVTRTTHGYVVAERGALPVILLSALSSEGVSSLFLCVPFLRQWAKELTQIYLLSDYNLQDEYQTIVLKHKKSLEFKFFSLLSSI